MEDRFTKENYENIRKKFEIETGVTLDPKHSISRATVPVKAIVLICICLTVTCASVFATDAGQEIIQKIFHKPVENETISVGFEEPHQTTVSEDDSTRISNPEDNLAITDPGHKGVDIVCDKGTPVYPVLEGTVIDAGFVSSYGNYIQIKHDDGYTSKYAHLESILVEIGQKVSVETQIGTVGSTGMSTGPQLHLEMTHNDELIDPSPYIFNQN